MLLTRITFTSVPTPTSSTPKYKVSCSEKPSRFDRVISIKCNSFISMNAANYNYSLMLYCSFPEKCSRDVWNMDFISKMSKIVYDIRQTKCSSSKNV